MARKHKCPPPGPPEWIVTWSDLISLLLCFFVIIVSFSEIKKEDDYQAVVEEIQKAFGMKGGGGKLPTEEDPALSLIQILEVTRMNQQDRITQRSQAEDPGMEGRHQAVKTVREGLMFAVGGAVTFEPGSADLSDQGRAELRQLAELFRGENNLVQLRGHAAPLELEGRPGRYTDLWELSAARAKAVMDFLTSDTVGIRAERVRLVAVADHEPLDERAITARQQAVNRRVEVLVTESLVQDHRRPMVRSGS